MKTIIATLTLAFALCACGNNEVQAPSAAPAATENAVVQDSEGAGTLAKAPGIVKSSLCQNLNLIGSWKQGETTDSFSTEGNDLVLTETSANSSSQFKVTLDLVNCVLQNGNESFKVVAVESQKVVLAPCADGACVDVVYSSAFTLTR